MSTIYRDATIVPRAMFLRNLKVYRRFLKYWETTHIRDENGDNVKVFKDRARNFYVGDTFIKDDANTRFIKAIGLSWDALEEQDIDSEIDSLYFVLKNFSDTKLSVPSKSHIVKHINYGINVGDQFTVTVEYGGSLKRYIKEHSLEYEYTNNGMSVKPLNTEEIRQVIFSNPWYYIGNSRHVRYDKGSTYDFRLYKGSTSNYTSSKGSSSYVTAVDTSSSSQVGILALLDNGSSFEQVGDVSSEEIRASKTGAVAYRFVVTYKYLGVEESSAVVSSILGWCNYYHNIQNNSIITVGAPISTKLQRQCYSMMVDETLDFVTPRITSDALFVKVPKEVVDTTAKTTRIEYTSYLKYDAFTSMKKANAVALIPNLLDTGYTVEAKEWWEDLLAIAIIIIAIVTFVLACTASVGTACVAAGQIAIEAVGIALGYAALVLTLGAYVLSEVGGLSSLDNVRLIGRLATIVGYVSMALGISSFLSNLANKSVEEGAKEGAKDVVRKSITERTIDSAIKIVDKVVDAVTSGLTTATKALYSAFTQSATLSVGQVANAVLDVVKVALKAYDYYLDQEKKKLDDTKKELEAEQDKYNEEVLNRPYRIGTNTYTIVESRLKDVDMLDDMSAMKENMVGKDKNYQAWLTDVNS